MATARNIRLGLVVGLAILAIVLLYLYLIPRSVADGESSRALLYFLLGWVPWTIAWYGIGRVFGEPEELPYMQPAYIGLALFLGGLLISLGIDRWGVSPETLPEAHVVQAIAIFVGLALFGWAIGRRSEAVARIARDHRR